MALRYGKSICLFGSHMQNNLPVMLRVINHPNIDGQSVRFSKHWNPKFKKERKGKVAPTSFPLEMSDFEEFMIEQRKMLLKIRGVLPEKPYSERPLYVSCSREIFDSYVVPEGDGKFSFISRKGAQQKLDTLQHKGQSMVAIRKIKQYDYLFNLQFFPEDALNIYLRAHEALTKKDINALRNTVTECALPTITLDIFNKTIRWKYLRSLEPPRIVHARCESLITDTNLFGQVTVRFHSQQSLAIYDRFGRLMQGSEILTKDVLEYVVFEKHVSNEYGAWRIHGKIRPEWMPPRELSFKTYIKPSTMIKKDKLEEELEH